jgi:hypothetical protein
MILALGNRSICKRSWVQFPEQPIFFGSYFDNKNVSIRLFKIIFSCWHLWGSRGLVDGEVEVNSFKDIASLSGRIDNSARFAELTT